MTDTDKEISMANQKTSEPSKRRAGGEQAPPKAELPKPQEHPEPPSTDGQDKLLQQLVLLAESVQKLANQPPPTPTPTPTAETPPTTPATLTSAPTLTSAQIERLRTLFDYTFLGEILGRPGFIATRATVLENNNAGIKFDNLNGATVAQLTGRLDDEFVVELIDIRDSTVLPDKFLGEFVDSFVFLDGRESRVPLAVAFCLEHNFVPEP
jgi:hypothetical protein